MRIALIGAELEENLAVRYIWAALERAGHDVVQVVFNQREDTEEAARELAASGAELAGFSMVFTYRARQFAQLATRARELGFAGHMVAGGHFAAFNAEGLLRDVPAFDSVARGEGEAIACRLAENLDRMEAVEGLIWRAPGGKIVCNPPVRNPQDLDTLAPPVHREPFDDYLGVPIANMLTSRGCTHACLFCSIVAWHRMCGGLRHRTRTPESVADEMAQLYGRGVRIFNFHDDNFFLKNKTRMADRVRALERALADRDVGRIAFAVKARPDEVDENLFAYLKRFGLFRVFLGIEAGTADSLKKLGRGQTFADNRHALDVVNRLDLHTCFNLLMLNPDSTLEDFAANVAFLRNHPHNPMNFCRTEIYSGTPLESKLRRQHRLLGDYWGHTYRVADPAAEELFQVVYPAFEERNFGALGVHHQAMAVDYEHQLLEHFFGTHNRLRKRVKNYICAVNLNTCSHLEEGVASVRSGFSSGSARRAFREELTRRVEADNRRLYALGCELTEQIRAEALESRAQRRGRRLVKTAAAVGFLSLGTLLAQGCDGSTHVYETIARPAEGDPALIRDQVAKEILPLAVNRMDRPQAIRIVLALDDKGGVYHCSVRLIDDRSDLLIDEAVNLTFKQPNAGGKTYSIAFTAMEVETAIAQAIPPSPEPPKPLVGDPALIKPYLLNRAGRYLAQSLGTSRDVKVDLRLDDKGKVTFAAVSGPLMAPAVQARATAFLLELRFRTRSLFGKTFSVVITAAELKNIRRPHMCEYAAQPPHPAERAPMPPDFDD